MPETRPRTAAEHHERVAGMSEMQNAVLNLPHGSDAATIIRTIRGVYQRAIALQAGQTVADHPQAHHIPCGDCGGCLTGDTCSRTPV